MMTMNPTPIGMQPPVEQTDDTITSLIPEHDDVPESVPVIPEDYQQQQSIIDNQSSMGDA